MLWVHIHVQTDDICTIRHHHITGQRKVCRSIVNNKIITAQHKNVCSSSQQEPPVGQAEFITFANTNTEPRWRLRFHLCWLIYLIGLFWRWKDEQTDDAGLLGTAMNTKSV